MPKTTTSTTTIQIHTHTLAKKGNEMEIFVAAFVQMECPIGWMYIGFFDVRLCALCRLFFVCTDVYVTAYYIFLFQQFTE